MAAASRVNTSIEFVVIPQEDLYLEGGIRKLFRVATGVSYPCQMQKNQNFSCLFRHYAKHNGLRKEDLIFEFTDELQSEQSPESVHLMPSDEIWVYHKKQDKELNKVPTIKNDCYLEHFRSLLNSNLHADIAFMVGSARIKVNAHKAILSARSEYFFAMFRPGGLSESSTEFVEMERHEESSFCNMLEFVYTNKIRDIELCDASEIISLIMIANEFILDDLKALCGQEASRVLDITNIGKFMLLSSSHNVPGLREACMKFVKLEKSNLRLSKEFCLEIESNPELGLLLFDALQDFEHEDSSDVNISGSAFKRARVGGDSLNPSSGSVHELIPPSYPSQPAATTVANSFPDYN